MKGGQTMTAANNTGKPVYQGKPVDRGEPVYRSLGQYRSHSRDWHDNLYVYPVISRRSRGLSIGINLNPDTACNFDCVYCQVDRSSARRAADVDPARVSNELARMIADAQSGALFADPIFADVPEAMRKIKDIAFSGDGEPTTCRHFGECVELVAGLKSRAGLTDTRIILITDACYLTKPKVAAALAVLDENNGEIWAKLDAGTESYYRKVNRPNYPLRHVIDNIISAGRVRPVVIQSLFMRLHDRGPDEAELVAYTERLHEITGKPARHGKSTPPVKPAIDRVQIYTVARRPAESFVTPLADAEVDGIVDLVRERTGLPTEAFYSNQ